MQKKITGLFLFFLVLFFCGCVATQPTPVEKAPEKETPQIVDPDPAVIQPIIEENAQIAEEPEDIVHHVKYDGETLSIIAKWYTGAYKNWDILAKSNPDINPDLLYLNSKIIIPGELVIRKEPMSKEFVVESLRKNSPKNRNEDKYSEDIEELQLFGPKTNQKE